MKKDLLDKPQKTKLPLILLELFMMSRDLSEEDIPIKLFNMIKSIYHMTSLTRMEDHTLVFQMSKDKQRNTLQNKYQPWYWLK